MKQALYQIATEAWMDANPAGLSDRQAEDMEALAEAEIEILDARHLVQKSRELVRPGRTLPFTWLWAPLRGRVDLRVGRQRRVVTARELVLIPAGVSHGAVALTKRFEVISLHVQISLEGALSDQALFRKIVHVLPDPAAWHRQLDTIVSLERLAANARAGAPILRYLLMSLVRDGERLAPSPVDVDPRVVQAVTMMRKAVTNGVRIQEIRREVGLGTSQFGSLFRKATGMPPQAYYSGIRIQSALKLLRQPALSVKEIAARLGYYDAQHFEKAFKAEFGMTPGAFHKQSSQRRRKGAGG